MLKNECLNKDFFTADDIPAQEKYVDEMLIKWHKIKDVENKLKTILEKSKKNKNN